MRTFDQPIAEKAVARILFSLSATTALFHTRPMTLHQGDCITLTSDENLYQVIGVDDHHNRCWVRRWPLARHGSPVFEISLQQVASHSHHHPPRLVHGA